jgi:adenylate cyclase
MEQALAFYDPSRHRALAFQYGADQQSTCLAWLSFGLSLLGYPEQAERTGRKAIALAEEIAHAITMAHALRYGGCFSCIVRRDSRTAREHAITLSQYAERQRLPFWSALARFILAWTSVETGRSQVAVTRMHTALADLDATGSRLDRPFFLAMLAERYGRIGQPAEGLHLLDEALAQVEETDERWWEAEIHRLKGVMLLSLSAENAAVAEECYQRAISLARSQGAKSLELRAGSSLARLRQSMGRSDEVGILLTPIYGWFTEGFDSADLKEAKALLDGIAREIATKS